MTEDPVRLGVLLVEHDPDTQSALVKVIAGSGARVVGTGSGEAAIALFDAWPTGLVVVNDEIPGLSGLEVARRIHAASPSVPIVLMSARPTSEGSALAARLAGVFATLAMPFDHAMLADLVRSLVPQLT
jgi:DNA-binding response OmpR family regulator